MKDSSKHIKIPTYSTDKRRLVQITEIIINGRKVIKEVPLRAYQTITSSRK